MPPGRLWLANRLAASCEAFSDAVASMTLLLCALTVTSVLLSLTMLPAVSL